MKVRELIEKLQAMPQDMNVWVVSPEGETLTMIDVELVQYEHANPRVCIFSPEDDEPDSADPIVRNGR
jgi:hypothetical protein